MPPPDSQLARARDAAKQGDLATAIELCNNALLQNPDDPEAHHILGLVLAHAGRRQPALEHLRTATELQPDNPTLLLTLAQHLAAASRFQPALDAFNRVRQLTPYNVSAHVDAAALLEMHARTDEARHAIEDALAIDPTHAPARIAAIRLDFRTTDPGRETRQAWQSLLRHLADTADAARVRADALDVLIDVAESLDNFDAAWLAINQFNETESFRNRRTLPTPQARDAYLRSVEALAQAVSPESTARWRDQRPDDNLPAPALLVGFPRSGTTMTEHALDAHPRIRSIEEQATFEHVRAGFESILPPALAVRPAHETLDQLTSEHVAALRAAYWRRVTDLLGLDAPPTDTLILDKLPLRITGLALVNRIFPEAKILVALRDPRDVCLSCFRQGFNYANVAMSFFLNLADTARLYTHVMGAYLETRGAYTNPALEIRYEQTVADFEPRIRAMLEFLGLGFDPAVLHAHERTDRLHATPSYHTVQREVSTRAVARWKNYQTHLAPILPALKPLIAALGYAP